MLSISLTDSDSGRQFSALNQEKRDLAAKLGLEIVDHAEACVQDWGETEWQQRLATLQSSLKAQSEDASHRLETAVREARSSERVCTDAEIQRLRDDAERWRQKMIDAQTEAAQRRDCALEQATNKAEERQDALRKEYEAKLDELRRRLEEAQGQQLCSTKKGNQGEEHVLAQLNIMFPQAEIEDTHATPGRGDFIVRDEGLVMMVETKNYTRNVPKAEVDKFFRDLENPGNEEFQCAVLVSLRSGVCCREDFSFEMHGNRPVLFIHHLERNFDNLALASKFFRLVLDAGESVDLQAKSTEDGLKAAASALKRGYTRQRAQINKFQTAQLGLIAEQEARLVQLYGLLGQKL
tara:strand:+ start:1732 stop:2784 length:1053 start_codon:yes stop_codon:yes gene_type:complete